MDGSLIAIVRSIGVVTLVSVTCLVGPATPGSAFAETDEGRVYGFGRAAEEKEIRLWDTDIRPDGTGLPPGRGTVQEGAAVYRGRCARCHGTHGGGGTALPLVGGHGTLDTGHPRRTVGSYWPYATTLYDYIRRAMPLAEPQSLTPNEVYALVAWILFHNGIIDEDQEMSARTLPEVRMPNRDGFVPDPRPDVPPR